MVRLNKKAVDNAVTEACQKAGRSVHSVQVVAVTKYLDVPETQTVIDAGICHLGENRADKFLAKVEAFKEQDITWHYIGSLQRRKVKDVINHIDYFHALDSLSLAKEIQKRAEKKINCFIQVNVSGEASKHGFSPNELDQVLVELEQLDKLNIIGLMTMAPFEAGQDELVAVFSNLRQLRDDIKEKKLKNMSMTELSMGMSGDFAIAIQEGATFVRIGSLFFE